MDSWNPALLDAPMWQGLGSDQARVSGAGPGYDADVLGRGRIRPDRSFERLPQPNEMHLPLGPDPVAAAVIFTLCLLVLMLGAILFVIVGSIAR